MGGGDPCSNQWPFFFGPDDVLFIFISLFIVLFFINAELRLDLFNDIERFPRTEYKYIHTIICNLSNIYFLTSGLSDFGTV